MLNMKTAFIIILLGVVISVAPLNFVDPEETNLGWLVTISINGFRFFNAAGFTTVYLANNRLFPTLFYGSGFMFSNFVG